MLPVLLKPLLLLGQEKASAAPRTRRHRLGSAEHENKFSRGRTRVSKIRQNHPQPPGTAFGGLNILDRRLAAEPELLGITHESRSPPAGGCRPIAVPEHHLNQPIDGCG